MKICVFGAGAIGGYLGVLLARAGADSPTFQITTTANPKQLRALALIQTIRP